MSDSSSTRQIEFVKLNGQAVRVTSWRPEGDGPGTYTMVTITRGSRDSETLDQLLAQRRIELQIGSEEVITVIARDIDRRAVGTGESGITRFAIVFERCDEESGAGAAVPARSVDDRLAALEAEVERLRTLVNELANRASR